MRLAQLASAVAGAALLAGTAAATQTLDFSPAEIKRILQHGPWPMPWKPDPSNRVSGRRDAVAFGGVSQFPARVKCALLGWMAMKDAVTQTLGVSHD